MLAIIDIGSNSVRLMLWANGKSLFKQVCTTRLGEGLAASGELSEAAMARTQAAVAMFCEKASSEEARTYPFATAAVRNARNGAAFCERIKAACGVEVDVVSGEEEALLGLTGALSSRKTGGIIDIGGASTEICFRDVNLVSQKKSLPVGCVSLYDRCGEDRAKLQRAIGDVLCGLDPGRTAQPVYSIGGTAATLTSLKLGLPSYDAGKMQETILTRDLMHQTAELLFSLSESERRKLPGMDASRADIIAGGALLLLNIMNFLHLDEVRFSDRDNLEGYLFARILQ